MLTQERKYASAATAYWLLKHGADPNARNRDGETPLLLCLGERLEPTDTRRNIVQMLLRMGADPNEAFLDGTTPLMLAARDDDRVLMDALVRAGAALDTTMPTHSRYRLRVPEQERRVYSGSRGEKAASNVPRILVAEDEPHILRLIQAKLEEAGYQVDTAVNGVEALARIRDRRPDLVVSDHGMPEMDGYDLLVRLRADPSLADLPVIIITVMCESPRDETMTWYRTRADRYMPKPFNPAELVRTIRQLLGQEGEEDAVAAKPGGAPEASAPREGGVWKRLLWWMR